MDIERGPKSYTILVVDDDELIRRVVQKTLANFGYTTASAVDGTQALKMAAELRPAIIMVDLHMPGIDGHTIMRRARAQGVDAAFVVISGSKDPEDIIDALRNGAADYLPKPFTVADLITATGRAIEAFEKKKTQPGPETLEQSAHGMAHGMAPAKPTPSAVTPAKVTTATMPALLPTTPPTAAPAPAPATAPRTTSTVVIAGNDPLFTSILRRIQEGEILIPPVPTVVIELRRLLADPDTGLETVTALIERDQRLTAQLLRVSNTTPYARGAQNTSIRTAVSRMGLRQIQSLVETVFAHSACAIRDPALAPIQESIWHFSVARAVAMRALAESQGAPRPDPELAYLAGLFCDVGATFLLWIISERNGAPGAPGGPGGPGSIVKLGAEDCLGFIAQNHQSVGSAILSRWSVDPTVSLLARVHHGNVLTNPVNPYAVLECVAAQAAERLTGAPDATGAPRDAGLVQECARRLKTPPLDALLTRIQPTYEAILNTLV
ncbi:MAG: two-component system, NtrC family, nitrogen regulation response regulator GlnG [Myxococcales bacterium]|nr:two-component system, NtrC family, nitrogen regulation response regulator GlnG [Myxococcales bacterium]